MNKVGCQNGRPPEGHERQCKRIKRCGNRCGKWAITGSEYCQFHGGRRNRKRVLYQTMPMFYSKVLNNTLTEAVEESLQLTTAEQLNLNQELALMRHLAGDAIELYTKATDNGKGELVTEATVLMREALRQVADICAKAAAVEQSRRDTLSPNDIKTVVSQIVRLLYDICGKDNEAIARTFEERVSTELKLPGEVRGTTLTPTKDVQEMINTIPAPPAAIEDNLADT